MGLGSSCCSLHGGARADIDCRKHPLISKACESGVDAVGGKEGVCFHVDGWDIDGASELLALFDGAGEFVGSAEDEGCVADSAMQEQPSNQ